MKKFNNPGKKILWKNAQSTIIISLSDGESKQKLTNMTILFKGGFTL